MCISHNMSGIKYTYPKTNNGRQLNYTEDPKIANKMVYKISNLLRKRSKQSKRSDKPNEQIILWFEKMSVFKENRGAPQYLCMI